MTERAAALLRDAQQARLAGDDVREALVGLLVGRSRCDQLAQDLLGVDRGRHGADHRLDLAVALVDEVHDASFWGTSAPRVVGGAVVGWRSSTGTLSVSITRGEASCAMPQALTVSADGPGSPPRRPRPALHGSDLVPGPKASSPSPGPLPRSPSRPDSKSSSGSSSRPLVGVGRKNAKRAPVGFVRAEVHQTWPPWRRTCSLTRDRPSPVPLSAPRLPAPDAAGEALEDQLPLLGRDAGALVLHADLDAAVHLVQGYGADPTARTSRRCRRGS